MLFYQCKILTLLLFYILQFRLKIFNKTILKSLLILILNTIILQLLNIFRSYQLMIIKLFFGFDMGEILIIGELEINSF